MSNSWSEIKREGETSTWVPVEGEELVGRLTGVRRDVGMNKSTIYEILTEENELVAVWETTVLKTKLEQVPEGSEVRIVYQGKKKSKSGPGTYHDYQVFSRKYQKSEEEKLFTE